MAEVRVHPPARDWHNVYSYGARCHLSGLLHMWVGLACVHWIVDEIAADVEKRVVSTPLKVSRHGNGPCSKRDRSIKRKHQAATHAAGGFPGVGSEGLESSTQTRSVALS